MRHFVAAWQFRRFRAQADMGPLRAGEPPTIIGHRPVSGAATGRSV